ncbi:MAG: hypothetical protein K2N54_02865, partial [Helicobacter sp.]|nr:hypothetical protein [Helicobacter sp.]
LCRTPQRCVYVMPCGSNIDVARCGWGLELMSNRKSKNCRIQSAAALWIRHVLRALFFEDSVLFPLPCGGGRGWVIASECNERGNQQAKNPNTSSI